jgi:hypothetical protein
MEESNHPTPHTEELTVFRRYIPDFSAVILDLSTDDFQNFADDAKLAAFLYTARNIFPGKKEWELFLKELFQHIDRVSDEKNVDFLELILVYIVKTRQDNPIDLINKLYLQLKM